MNEADQIKETIDLQKYLTRDQIEEIIDMAIDYNPYKGKGSYEGKLSMKLLRDALYTQGHEFENQFSFNGNEVIPKGSYELIDEIDLGAPVGKCENYGCGHPIRFEEHIRHKESGRTFIVGNVCVTKLLGEHDLIQIAVSLLSKISRQLDRLNKAKKIEEILGDLPETLKKIDPEGKFTHTERIFFRSVEMAQSKITIKQAQEIKQRWPLDKFTELIIKVRQEKEMTNMEKGEKKEYIQQWSDFLSYKQYENRRQHVNSDFIENCIEDLKVHDDLSQHRKETLQVEKDVYDRIRRADPELLIPINGKDTRLVMAKMLNHLKECSSYFYTSLLISGNYYSNLTPGQIGAVKNKPCIKCKKKLL